MKPTRTQSPEAAQARFLAKFARDTLRGTLKKPGFRQWFAGSRVVDAAGEPLLMWHGTTKKFDEFDESFMADSGAYGRGFYFTNHYPLAQEYSDGGAPIGAYLSIQEPWVDDRTRGRMRSFRGMAGKLEGLGHDGVLLLQPDDEVVGGIYVEAVALHPQQILIVSQ